MSGADKRVFPRFAVQMDVELETRDGRLHRGTSRNLSRGGLCLEVADAIATGEDVEVRVTLMFDDQQTSEPLELPARVVWCTPFGSTHQVGTQFRPLSPDRITYLDMFLRLLEQQSAAAVGGAADEDGHEDDPFTA